MNYLESTVYLESLMLVPATPTVERVELFLQESGNPQNKLNVIHVAGTNGKGSTVAMLDSALRAMGKKVGRYSGPHLLRWNERFHLNGEPISDKEFSAYMSQLRLQSQAFAKRHPDIGPLSWFELLTSLAFVYFLDNNVDVAVIEVGLGGRWDATNVISKPLVSVITSISLDHMHILGDNIATIAGEKAGIIKSGVPVVAGCCDEAFSEIKRAASKRSAPLIRCNQPNNLELLPTLAKSKNISAQLEKKVACTKHTVELLNGSNKVADLIASCQNDGQLQASYQAQNILLAVTALYAAGICSDEADLASIEEGIKHTYWPGRFQYIEHLNLILDGAHNADGALCLRQALDKSFPGSNFSFIISCYDNKDVDSVVKALVRDGDKVFASQAASRRATAPIKKLALHSIGQGAQAFECQSIAEAFDKAIEVMKSQATESKATGDPIVATGSFATIKEIMQHIGWKKVEDGLAMVKQ
jgi:dihydrofolate synthase/folylpolyglutamate synthase